MPVVVENVKTYKGNGIYIGRTRDPKDGVFGNPFSHLDGTLAKYKVATREEAISKYYGWMLEQIENDISFRLGIDELVRRHLRGETVVLACWCKPLPCHGDLLKELIEQLADLRVVTLHNGLGEEPEEAPF